MIPATPIDIDKARLYLKADGDDDDLISLELLPAAQQVCQDYCNRVFYDSVSDQSDDFVVALSDRTAALASRTTALQAVTGDTPDDWATRRLINDHYIQVFGDISKRIHGIVIDSAINAAILMTLGHLYKNREDNLATGNNVVQVPVGAQRILQTKLWIGNLVADSGLTDSYPTQTWPPEGS